MVNIISATFLKLIDNAGLASGTCDALEWMLIDLVKRVSPDFEHPVSVYSMQQETLKALIRTWKLEHQQFPTLQGREPIYAYLARPWCATAA